MAGSDWDNYPGLKNFFEEVYVSTPAPGLGYKLFSPISLQNLCPELADYDVSNKLSYGTVLEVGRRIYIVPETLKRLLEASL